MRPRPAAGPFDAGLRSILLLTRAGPTVLGWRCLLAHSGPHLMSPECAPKQTPADHSEFIGSHLGLPTAREPRRLRATTIWMRRVRQNNPTGKSVLFLRNRVKPKILQNQKYFCFHEARNTLHHIHPVPVRGAYHDRHERGWTLVVPKTNGANAHGKDVWS